MTVPACPAYCSRLGPAHRLTGSRTQEQEASTDTAGPHTGIKWQMDGVAPPSVGSDSQREAEAGCSGNGAETWRIGIFTKIWKLFGFLIWETFPSSSKCKTMKTCWSMLLVRSYCGHIGSSTTDRMALRVSFFYFLFQISCSIFFIMWEGQRSWRRPPLSPQAGGSASLSFTMLIKLWIPLIHPHGQITHDVPPYPPSCSDLEAAVEPEPGPDWLLVCSDFYWEYWELCVFSTVFHVIFTAF